MYVSAIDVCSLVGYVCRDFKTLRIILIRIFKTYLIISIFLFCNLGKFD